MSDAIPVIVTNRVADSSTVSGIRLPLMNGLLAHVEHFDAMASPEKARRNLVDGTTWAAVGAPTVPDDLGILLAHNTNYVQSTVPGTASFTRYVIAQVVGDTTTGPRSLVCNYVSGTGGDIFQFVAPTSATSPNGNIDGQVYLHSGTPPGTPTGSPLVNRPNVQNWGLYVMRYSLGVGTKLWDLTGGVSLATNSAIANHFINTATNMRLGGGSFGTAGGQVRLFTTTLYSVAHTDAEVETTMATYLRRVAAYKGLTV